MRGDVCLPGLSRNAQRQVVICLGYACSTPLLPSTDAWQLVHQNQMKNCKHSVKLLKNMALNGMLQQLHMTFSHRPLASPIPVLVLGCHPVVVNYLILRHMCQDNHLQLHDHLLQLERVLHLRSCTLMVVIICMHGVCASWCVSPHAQYHVQCMAKHRGGRPGGGPPIGGDVDGPPLGVGGSTELRAQLFGNDAAAAPTTGDAPPPVCGMGLMCGCTVFFPAMRTCAAAAVVVERYKIYIYVYRHTRMPTQQLLLLVNTPNKHNRLLMLLRNLRARHMV